MLHLRARSARRGERESGERIVELADQAQIESEAASPVESALARALELSANDGSIVLSAGSMFVTAEAMKAWSKMMSLRGRQPEAISS